MPTLDYVFDAEFSATIHLTGKDAEGAALYINDKLMDVVKLDPDSKDQQLLFWDGLPVHGALLGQSRVVVRVFSNTRNWTKHKMSFTSADINITREEHPGAAYIEHVIAKNYDGIPREACLCYSPEGLIGYLPREHFPGVGFYAREALV